MPSSACTGPQSGVILLDNEVDSSIGVCSATPRDRVAEFRVNERNQLLNWNNVDLLELLFDVRSVGRVGV
jgi:hypothetical protein